MNILLNYYGQLRNLELTKQMYLKYIQDENVTYHVLYTTWENTNTDEFIRFFPNAYINKIAHPDITQYNDILTNYTIDSTNNQRKTISHYVLGAYIKQQSQYTIDNYIKDKNISFEFVVTLRTDLYFKCKFSDYYKNILSLISNNTVFVAEQLKFDIYLYTHNQPALPDTITISNINVNKQILNQLDILTKCAVNGTTFFHPESSFYNMLKYNNLNIIELLNFYSFPEYL